MVAQLLGRLGDHGQIPLERPHLMVGNDEVGSLQARLGDVAAEHPLWHDLRLDRDPLAAPRRLTDREAVMEGVEPGLKTGREPHQPLPAEPELQLDGLTGPGFGTAPLAANWTGVATTGQKSPRVRLVLVPPAANDQSAIGYSRALRQARSSSRRRAIRS